MHSAYVHLGDDAIERFRRQFLSLPKMERRKPVRGFWLIKERLREVKRLRKLRDRFIWRQQQPRFVLGQRALSNPGAPCQICLSQFAYVPGQAEHVVIELLHSPPVNALRAETSLQRYVHPFPTVRSEA